MAKMVIKMISETEAQVTKAFAKNAVIFGTEEYKLWREYRKDFPNAKMVTKTIKKNPEKKTYRNLTYKNMELFISVQPKKEDENGNVIDYKKEFERQKLMAKVQSNPYKAVLAWFLATFENYSTYKTFFKELEELNMNNTKRNEKINELESIETVLGITKAEYAAEKLLEQYEKTGLRTEDLFGSLSSMTDEEIIEMYLDF